MATLLGLFISGCGNDAPESSAPIAEKLPEQLFAKISADPISVVAAKALKQGQSVIVKGKIMGDRQPFVDQRASFLLGDPAVITSCDLRHGDGCKTPWDTCCDDSTDIQKSTLNIQVLNPQGRIIKASLKGAGGLKELSQVIVKGKIDASSSAESTIINAETIEVL
jgi:hypothetical protein